MLTTVYPELIVSNGPSGFHRRTSMVGDLGESTPRAGARGRHRDFADGSATVPAADGMSSALMFLSAAGWSDSKWLKRSWSASESMFRSVCSVFPAGSGVDSLATGAGAAWVGCQGGGGGAGGVGCQAMRGSNPRLHRRRRSVGSPAEA